MNFAMSDIKHVVKDETFQTIQENKWMGASNIITVHNKSLELKSGTSIKVSSNSYPSTN